MTTSMRDDNASDDCCQGDNSITENDIHVERFLEGALVKVRSKGLLKLLLS